MLLGPERLKGRSIEKRLIRIIHLINERADYAYGLRLRAHMEAIHAVKASAVFRFKCQLSGYDEIGPGYVVIQPLAHGKSNLGWGQAVSFNAAHLREGRRN